MHRRRIHAISISGAATSQNGSVAPSRRPPRVAGTQSTRMSPTIAHAINAPIGGRASRRGSGRGNARTHTEGDAENGAMSMDDSVVSDGAILKRRGLTG